MIILITSESKDMDFTELCVPVIFCPASSKSLGWAALPQVMNYDLVYSINQ
jgi:hypothetical protein